MSVRVVVRDGESLAVALRRFKQMVHREYNRPADRRRYGYYEKPSELRRKRQKLRERSRQAGTSLKVGPGVIALFRRTGPANSLGH
jgi:ribosomal protein S21